MCRQIVLFLFVFIGLTLAAQPTINVRGKVLKADKPIAGAIVTLATQALKDTSGADGAYAITKGVVSVLPVMLPQSEKIFMNKGVLELNLTNSSPVKVEIFDLKGVLLKKEYLPSAEAGVYHWNISENSRAANQLVIHASIGQRQMTFRCLPLNNGRYALNSASENAIGGKLAKITVVSDTLKVSAANYKDKAVAIASYDTTVNITLDTNDAGGAVTVALDKAKQKIDGFGINNCWQPAMSADEATMLFDTTAAKGIGLSILRLGMEPDGSAMGSFDDVKKAKALGVKNFIASVWTAPATLKSNNNVNGGGHLKDDAAYATWATAVAAFPAKVKSQGGVDLYAMGVANEPDFASCGFDEPCNGDYKTMVYTGEEMVKFVKAVGPKLRALNPPVKVLAPEPSEWTHLWSDTSGCCSEPNKKNSSDPLGCGFPPSSTKCPFGKGYDYGHVLAKDTAAWNLVDIIGVHEYDAQRAQPWPSDVPTMKPVYQTEMSGVKWWPEQGSGTGDNVKGTATIENGVAVGGWIHDAIVNGPASAWCWWWLKPLSNGTDDNEGLLLKSGGDTKRRYVLGNYSKFVRPGFTRVDITGAIPKDVLLSAYKGNGGVVIVAINKGAAAATVPITISGGTAPTSFTPWVTSKDDDLKSGTAVNVSAGVLTAALPSMTVTTFVGK
jgi:glucuronoarabinoxylan endo-1,4-beta-xylanase